PRTVPGARIVRAPAPPEGTVKEPARVAGDPGGPAAATIFYRPPRSGGAEGQGPGTPRPGRRAVEPRAPPAPPPPARVAGDAAVAARRAGGAVRRGEHLLSLGHRRDRRLGDRGARQLAADGERLEPGRERRAVVDVHVPRAARREQVVDVEPQRALVGGHTA